MTIWLFQAWSHYYHFGYLQKDDGHFAVLVAVVVAVAACQVVCRNFFLFGPRHFQLFTKDNHKIIRWLWTVTKTVAYYITKKSNKIFSAYSWFQISAYVNCDGCLLRQSLLVHVYFYFSFLRKRTRPWYILSNFTQTLSFCLFERRWESW